MTAPHTVRTEPAEPLDHTPEPTDYRPLVRSLASAALKLLLVKTAAVVLISNFVGATIQLEFLFNVFPFFRVIAPPDDFATVATFSTVLMAAAAALLLAPPAIEGDWERQLVWGRGLALLIGMETYTFEVVRQAMQPPVLLVRWLWIPGFVLICGAALLGIALGLVAHESSSHAEPLPIPR